jgi:hypothetical protein
MRRPSSGSRGKLSFAERRVVPLRHQRRAPERHDALTALVGDARLDGQVPRSPALDSRSTSSAVSTPL